MKLLIFLVILTVIEVILATENPVVLRIKTVSPEEYRAIVEAKQEGNDESQRSDSRFIGEAFSGLSSIASGLNLGQYISRLFGNNRETKALDNYPICSINAPGRDEGRQFDLSAYPSIEEIVNSLGGQGDNKKGPPVINCILVVDESTTKTTTTRKPKRTTTQSPDFGPTFQPIPQPPTYAPWYPGGYPGSHPGGFPGSHPGRYPAGHPTSLPGDNSSNDAVQNTTEESADYPNDDSGSNDAANQGGYPGSYPGSYLGGYPGAYPPYYPPYGRPVFYTYVPYPAAEYPAPNNEETLDEPAKLPSLHSQVLQHLLHVNTDEGATTTRRPRHHSGAKPTRRRRVGVHSRILHPETS